MTSTKRLTIALVALVASMFVSALVASAQTTPVPLVDHWATKEECIGATTAPFYLPSILRQQPLAENEVIRGLVGGCYKMDLPDRLGGVGWVRIESGRPGVFDRRTSGPLRLKECNNKLHEWEFFPPTPLADSVRKLKGDPGPPGRDGVNGIPGAPGRPGRDGFCSSGKCRWAVAIVSGVVVGGVIYAVTRNNHPAKEVVLVGVRSNPPGFSW